MSDKIKEVLGVFDLAIDPNEVAAFVPSKHKFSGEWKMTFLMKSGETISTEHMNEVAFRSWKHKLQLLFDYIHPGKLEEWKVKKGFTGYLDMTGVKNKKIREAEEKKPSSIKDLFKK